MRRTKIVCTLGPASSSLECMEALIHAGMDVARVNMSHGTHAVHAQVIARLRKAAKRAGREVAVLQDLQGPKIRVGLFAGGKVELAVGAAFTLTTRKVLGTADIVSTSYRFLPQDAKAGDKILLDDGRLRLRVEAVRGADVLCQVELGGWLSNNKGINLPGVTLSTPSVTAKDLADLRFGLEQGLDYAALSFVRHQDDVAKVKRVIAAAGRDMPVIAKIEKPEALEHLRGITRTADGIMVARGDLGVELDLEKVPLIQKEIIAMANQAQCLVITATQMLESMTENSSPTRAEVSDVANAILDGTDAVMLSGETAAGKHPVEAAETMARVCETTENSQAFRSLHGMAHLVRPSNHRSIADAVCYAARAASEDLRVRAIVCFTQSGSTARTLSKYRPEVPIYAFTPRPRVLSRLGLHWGTEGFFVAPARSTDRLFAQTCAKLIKMKKVVKGDTIILVSGTPIGEKGTINMLKIHKV